MSNLVPSSSATACLPNSPDQRTLNTEGPGKLVHASVPMPHCSAVYQISVEKPSNCRVDKAQYTVLNNQNGYIKASKFLCQVLVGWSVPPGTRTQIVGPSSQGSRHSPLQVWDREKLLWSWSQMLWRVVRSVSKLLPGLWVFTWWRWGMGCASRGQGLSRWRWGLDSQIFQISYT